jgi:prephenate dehydrogenase
VTVAGDEGTGGQADGRRVGHLVAQGEHGHHGAHGLTTARGVETVHIVGTGLIGTSIGLALSGAGVDVTLEDPTPGTAKTAAERGAGRVSALPPDVDMVLLAMPPSHVAGALVAAERLTINSTLMDVASVKSEVLREAELLGADMARFVPSHPVAGRERGGPENARADLFQGRAWALTPGVKVPADRVRSAEAVVAMCGARAVHLTAAQHDEAMALVSHLPQLLASALAAQLVDAPFDVAVLAGQGLRDSTRIAESDPQLWADIASANAQEIAPLVDRVRAELDRLATALRSGDAAHAADAVRALVAQGQRGRSRVGATHGRPEVPVDVVSVLLRDTPGELASIFLALRDAGVNVDDIRIDHAPGEAVGVLELVVAHEAGAAAVQALTGWRARVSSSTKR